MRRNRRPGDRPDWHRDREAPAGREDRFLLCAGRPIGVRSHLADDDRTVASVDIVTAEAMKTSEIEGGYPDRASVRPSARHAFGLSAVRRRGAAERGTADLPSDAFATSKDPLALRKLPVDRRAARKGPDRLPGIEIPKRRTDDRRRFRRAGSAPRRRGQHLVQAGGVQHRLRLGHQFPHRGVANPIANRIGQLTETHRRCQSCLRPPSRE